jgi:hypothetical protein
MEETYTYDALVQFLYHELSAQEVTEMTQSLEEDLEMLAVFQSLVSAKAQFPQVQFVPSNGALNNILQYSAKTMLEVPS